MAHGAMKLSKFVWHLNSKLIREKFAPGSGFEPRSPALCTDALPLSYSGTYHRPAANPSLYLYPMANLRYQISILNSNKVFKMYLCNPTPGKNFFGISIGWPDYCLGALDQQEDVPCTFMLPKV